MPQKRSWIDRLMSIDRRIIFVLIALAVIIPLFLDIPAPSYPTGAVIGVYEAVESVPPGSVILISFEHDPGTDVEIRPMGQAVFKHCLRRGLRFIIMGLWPQGPELAENALEEVLALPEFAEQEVIYGEDYAILGYVAGGAIVLQAMGSSIRTTFPQDKDGTPIDELPILDGITNFKNIALVIDLSSGDPGMPSWVMYGHDRFGVRLAGGCTAVSAPGFYPYLQRGQIEGLMGGLKGAAEYEALIESPGSASQLMLPQTIAHIVIVVFIIIGNIAYFASRRRERK
jgi:hypothetical protein